MSSIFDLSFFIDLLYYVPAILISLTIHECAHGYAASLLGDPTAKASGRLTLNPLKHVDVIGLLSLILFHFGWAKPVPVNPGYFKDRKRDMALTALAGPVSNFLLGFIALFFYALSFHLGASFVVVKVLMPFFSALAVINVSLAIFNLIPVPPLDGSKVLAAVLPDRMYFNLLRFEQYGYLILLILLFTGILSRPLSAACSAILSGMLHLFSLMGL